MTYRLVMMVERPSSPVFGPGGRRELVTRIAGCVDEAEAKAKARALYAGIVTFKKCEAVDDGRRDDQPVRG